MSIPLEIERKFLVKNLEEITELQLTVGYYIRQAYVLNRPEISVRVRVEEYFGQTRNTRAVLCIKRSVNGSSLVREEEQFDMDVDTAADMIEGMCVIDKTRYTHDGYDIDVFNAALDGLVVVEREFRSIEDAESFALPSWIKEDVTEDPAYINANLIGKRYENGTII